MKEKIELCSKLYYSLVYGPSRLGNTWIRNAESRAQPCTYWNRIVIFTGFPGDLCVYILSFRSTGLVLNVHFGPV